MFKKDSLFVLSEIPTGQKEILKLVPLSTVKNADTLLSYYNNNTKIRRLCFLNYDKIKRIRYKNIIVLQYFSDDEQKERYRQYLKKIVNYYKYIRLYEKDENSINSIDDREVKAWLFDNNNNITTNAEMPLKFLDEEESKEYINTFECEFGNYVYKLVPNREKNDIEKFLANLVDNINVSGQKHFVVNLGEKKYRDALLSIYKNRGLPFVAIDCNNYGYDFILHPKIQKIYIEKSYLNYLSEQDDHIKELSQVAKGLQIPEPDPAINVKRYYEACISKKLKVPFLIMGNTGVGKTYFVNSIITNSEKKKFHLINCATLSNELIRSELFGHVRGAFTGANKDKEGYLTKFKDGIIFLDEIGEISLQAQAKILKFLDNRTYSPVGSVEQLKSNVYLIFATNRDLKDMCKKGNFRWDLYYRITKYIITIPPFDNLPRQKKKVIIKKIEDNCNAQLRKESPKINKSPNLHKYLSKKLGVDAVNYIMHQYHWPGNLREIYNTVLRSFMFSQGGEISRNKLKKYVDISPKSTPKDPFTLEYKDIVGKNAKSLIHNFRNHLIEISLKYHNGNQAKAARSIKITPQTFNNWLKKSEKKLEK